MVFPNTQANKSVHMHFHILYLSARQHWSWSLSHLSQIWGDDCHSPIVEAVVLSLTLLHVQAILIVFIGRVLCTLLKILFNFKMSNIIVTICKISEIKMLHLLYFKRTEGWQFKVHHYKHIILETLSHKMAI